MRTGADYRESLRDGRQVFLDGRAVADVTTHPAFAGPVAAVAGLYDLARDPANRAEVTHPGPDGRPLHNAWLIPREPGDLGRRRRAHELWQEATFGLLGRSPDHVACFLSGFAGAAAIFGRAGTRFAEHATRFHAWAAGQDIYACYAIVPPQGDRSQPGHRQRDPHLYAGVVQERDDGIVLRGAQGVATGAVLAEWLLLSNIVPLPPGDEDYALSLMLPLGAPGVRIYPRRPYATQATSVFDYPLSSRYDEVDALIVLDRVFVPWEHVFIYRDRALCQAQFLEGPAHVLGNFQALVRLAVKLRFLLGVTRRICDLHGTATLAPVQAQLGELAAHAALVEACVRGAEQAAAPDAFGVLRPNREMVYAGLVLQPAICAEALQLARELIGGSGIALPSSADMFRSPETEGDVRTFFAAGETPAEVRAKVLRLAWDLMGTEFAGRQMQYETFYAGSPFLARLRTCQTYDWTRAERLVERCLQGYGLDTPLPGSTDGRPA